MPDQHDHHATKKRAFIATTAIFGSRIFGLIREQVFAFFFGAGAVLDAFIVAFRIPNLMRDLFAEGALSQSFVTIFSQKLATDDQKHAYQLANKVSTFIILFMGTLVVLGMIFSPQIVSLVASGFTGEKFHLTVKLMRILFPFIFFVSLSALLMGMLNAQHKFFIPHSASTFFNFISITVGLAFAYWLSPDYISHSFQKIIGHQSPNITDFLAISNAITGMALGSLLGGLGQYLFQIPTAWRLGFRPKLDFKLKDSALIKVLKLTGPAVIGGAAVQVNVLVNTEFASLLADGAVSWLNFAFRFMQFPLGIFGVAIASASAPALAKLIAKNQTDDFKQTIQSSMQLSLFLSIPSTIGLIVIGREIIALIYQHGRFDLFDTTQTYYALAAYSLGICSYSLIKIYQPAFLAFHNAKTPMKVSLFSILANASINAYFILVLKLNHWALALGTASVATINLVLLSILFRNNLKGVWSKHVIINLLKTLLAGILMGIVIWNLQTYVHDYFTDQSFVSKFWRVFIPMTVAIPVYFALAYIFNNQDAHYILNRLPGVRKIMKK